MVFFLINDATAMLSGPVEGASNNEEFEVLSTDKIVVPQQRCRNLMEKERLTDRLCIIAMFDVISLGRLSYSRLFSKESSKERKR